MKIEVQFFSRLRDLAGTARLELDLPPGATVGDALAQTLGGGRAVLLRAHGATVVGADIVECFALATYLEDNAQRQYLASQLGAVYEFTEAEQRACEANLYKPWLFTKVWDYYRAKLR